MKNVKVLLSALTLIIVSGCVGTNMRIDQSYTYNVSDSFSYNIIDQARVSEEGMNIFKIRLDSKLKELGLSSENSNKIIEITFNNYYMRNGAARALVGVFAGADNITSTVLVKEKDSGNVVGKLQLESKNPTATSSASELIEQHADQIENYIKSGKS